MTEGIESWGENSGIETDISGALAEHFREAAESGFPDDIHTLEEAFFQEKGISREDVVME